MTLEGAGQSRLHINSREKEALQIAFRDPLTWARWRHAFLGSAGDCPTTSFVIFALVTSMRVRWDDINCRICVWKRRGPRPPCRRTFSRFFPAFGRVIESKLRLASLKVSDKQQCTLWMTSPHCLPHVSQMYAKKLHNCLRCNFEGNPRPSEAGIEQEDLLSRKLLQIWQLGTLANCETEKNSRHHNSDEIK